MKILVTGATGNAGGAVVAELGSRPGFRVLAGTRSPEAWPRQQHVEAVRISFEDPGTFDAALTGVNAIFLMAPPMDPQSDKKLAPVLDCLKAHRIGHVVFNSSFGMEQFEEAPLRKFEHMLMNSGVPWTILRPNFFMENFSSGLALTMIRRQGGIFMAAGEGRTSFISTVDVARVARAALEQRLFGAELSLTGPQALTHTQVASIITDVSGSPVRYYDLDEEEMLEGARAAGMPEHAVQYLSLLYGLIRSGRMAPLTDEVRRITGGAALTFRDFARRNTNVWANN